ncbi:hypothetical protein PSN45_002069 [Yamadazyma tenuis]|uniref:uncharacterized protein n=1 Tax=Candida tenuis TaxID=2315449 RepID=UPI00279AF98F|nr:hypothetical protein PSN45_002069 [Yamadazyma tenuis]
MENYETLVEYLNDSESEVSSIAYQSVVLVESDATSAVLMRLYIEQKYREMLAYASVEDVSEWTSQIRLVLALMLFKLGRYKAAMREVAIAADMEVNLLDRRRYLRYEAKLLSILGLKDRLAVCKYAEEYEYQEGVATSTKESSMVPELDETMVTVKVSVPPIHEQALMFISSYGHLPELSLGKVSIMAHKRVADAVAALDHKYSDPLGILYEAAILFAPQYVFKPVAENKHRFAQYLRDQLDKYPEIDVQMDVRQLVKMVGRLERAASSSAASIANLMVKFQFCYGMLHVVSHDYYEASYYFLWTLNFLTLARRQLHPWFNRSEYLSSITIRCCAMMLCQCIEFGKIQFSVFSLENIILKFSMEEVTNPSAEFFSNRAGTQFIAYGVLYEQLAYKQAKKLMVEDTVLLRYEQNQMVEMVRKYVLASILRPQDDPKIVVLLDRAIWGMLMYGGMHLTAVWFFQHLRHYYQLALDFGPLQCSNSLEYTLFSEEHKRYSNMPHVLLRFAELYSQLCETEVKNSWDEGNGDVFLLPLVFASGNRLVLMDKFYDETSLYHDMRNFEFDGFGGLRTKLRSHCKLSHKLIHGRCEVSRDLA